MKEKKIKLIFESFETSKYSIFIFVLSISLINIIFYLLKLPDDRALLFTPSSPGWLVGDFSSYKNQPVLQLFREFLLGLSTESSIKIGPFLPALILISQKLFISNLLIKIFAIFAGISNILLIHSIIPKMFTDISWVKKFKYFKFFGKTFKISSLDFSSLLGFALNPLILYYFAFPSTDAFFTTTFFIVLLLSIDLTTSLKKSKFLSHIDLKRIWIISFTLLIGMLIRTSGILNFFLIIIPCYILIRSFNKYWRKLIVPSIFLSYIVIFSTKYYLPYAKWSSQHNLDWTNGISLWNTPLASRNWETNKLNNIMAHTLSFPFKFSESSGLRPSYVTIKDGEEMLTNTKKISESNKPFFYIFLRSNWAFFVVIPSFIMFIINIISNPSLEKFIFLIAIISVPLLLTYSIVLERYFIHCSSLLACLFLPLFNDIKENLKKK